MEGDPLFIWLDAVTGSCSTRTDAFLSIE